MAEANYHGKTAMAHWKLGAGAFAPISNMIEWSVSLTSMTAESSVMHASAHGKSREPGFKGGTATVTCFLPGDVEIDEGAEGTLELLRNQALNADKGYEGACICTGVDTGVDKDGVETVTYSFTFTGAVTCTVTEGVA